MAYVHSKRALSTYVHDLATELAPRGIRANVVHPTNCNTDMLQSEPMYKSFRPDLEHPTQADAEPVFYVQQAMKVPWIEPDRHQQRRAVAGLRRGALRHRHAGARGRRRLPQVVRLPHLIGGHREGLFVDPERCQGHTLCSMIAPDSFELSDIDGTSSPVSEDVPPAQEDAVREAAHSCPEQAITVEE